MVQFWAFFKLIFLKALKNVFERLLKCLKRTKKINLVGFRHVFGKNFGALKTIFFRKNLAFKNTIILFWCAKTQNTVLLNFWCGNLTFGVR
jgi:hypothetical protein